MDENTKETSPFSKEEIDGLREVLKNYERSMWLGGLIFKLGVGVTSVIAIVAQFKSNIMALFK